MCRSALPLSESESEVSPVVSNSLWPQGLQPTGLLRPWDFPDQSTGGGCHFLLQGIFLTQGSNPGLLYCRQILYHLSYREVSSPSKRKSLILTLHLLDEAFCDSSVGKESACNAGDLGSIPGSGRSAGEGVGCLLQYSWASLVAQLVKNPPTMWETWVWSLGWEDPLEKEKVRGLWKGKKRNSATGKPVKHHQRCHLSIMLYPLMWCEVKSPSSRWPSPAKLVTPVESQDKHQTNPMWGKFYKIFAHYCLETAMKNKGRLRNQSRQEETWWRCD